MMSVLMSRAMLMMMMVMVMMLISMSLRSIQSFPFRHRRLNLLHGSRNMSHVLTAMLSNNHLKRGKKEGRKKKKE